MLLLRASNGFQNNLSKRLHHVLDDDDDIVMMNGRAILSPNGPMTFENNFIDLR